MSDTYHPDVERTEFHVIDPSVDEAVDWFDDQAEAIAAATINTAASGRQWKVIEVVTYSADRKTVFPAPVEDED